MATVLITGANRGLGLEFAHQYAVDGWRVIAACRDPARARELAGVKGEVELAPLDVTDPDTIRELAARLEEVDIDLLLLNAGVHLQKRAAMEQMDYPAWARELAVNTMAPLQVAAGFAPHVARSELKRIVAISSGAGSISRTKFGDDYAYRSSKAGLNAVMKILSFELAARGITVISIGPGHTITDMGGAEARYTAEDSVTRVRAVIAGLSFADNGRYVSRDGEDIPW